jgi:hypothetical protein
MMSDLYLILHRVRGQSAFDIATPLAIGDENGWIIPTSGHRAYPYHTWKLYDLGLRWSANNVRGITEDMNLEMPPNWPDHYPTSATPKLDAKSLLAELGLKPAQTSHPAISSPLKRRI